MEKLIAEFIENLTGYEEWNQDNSENYYNEVDIRIKSKERLSLNKLNKIYILQILKSIDCTP